ncbi:MAG: heme-binding domain-containing protein, partial [Anaerolineae bacterium]|nr:heme-binding domain-containing protein [Anaerolineae bacterium]
EGGEMAEQIERGTMPPNSFKLLHPDANLSAEEQAQLIQGLRATFGEGR